jgi:phytoene/squalene synthetase
MVEEPEDSEELVHLITQSGFTIVPLQTIIDALADMEKYIQMETGLSQEDLEKYLKRVENVVGKEEAIKLELDEIVSWIRAIRGN